MRSLAPMVVALACACRFNFDTESDAPNACTPIPGLLAYFPMNTGDLTGSTLADRSGHGLSATLIGAATLPTAAGHDAEALDFTGTVDTMPVYFQLPAMPLPTAVGDAVTVTMWYSRSGAPFPNDVLVDLPPPDVSFRYDLWLAGTATCVNSAFGDCWGVNDVSLFARWVFLAAILRNGLTIDSELYVDGQQRALACVSAPTNPCDQMRQLANPARLSSHDGYQFRGLMDEVRFYDHALSAAEIAAIYAGTQCP